MEGWVYKHSLSLLSVETAVKYRLQYKPYERFESRANFLLIPQGIPRRSCAFTSIKCGSSLSSGGKKREEVVWDFLLMLARCCPAPFAYVKKMRGASD